MPSGLSDFAENWILRDTQNIHLDSKHMSFNVWPPTHGARFVYTMIIGTLRVLDLEAAAAAATTTLVPNIFIPAILDQARQRAPVD